MNFSRNLNELEFEVKVFASELKLFRSVQKKESKLFPYLPESTSPFVSMGAVNFDQSFISLSVSFFRCSGSFTL